MQGRTKTSSLQQNIHEQQQLYDNMVTLAKANMSAAFKANFLEVARQETLGHWQDLEQRAAPSALQDASAKGL